jgi:hypothetical protein
MLAGAALVAVSVGCSGHVGPVVTTDTYAGLTPGAPGVHVLTAPLHMTHTDSDSLRERLTNEYPGLVIEVDPIHAEVFVAVRGEADRLRLVQMADELRTMPGVVSVTIDGPADLLPVPPTSVR